MAKKTIVQLIDDIDGTALDHDEGETVEFGLDGKFYLIDLSEKNATVLRSVLKPYADNARTIRNTRAKTRSFRPSGSGRTAKELAAIRDWARDNDYNVASRGRISAEVLQSYDAAIAVTTR